MMKVSLLIMWISSSLGNSEKGGGGRSQLLAVLTGPTRPMELAPALERRKEYGEKAAKWYQVN